MALEYVPQEGTKEWDVFQALRDVMDPEIGLSIVELGLIRGMDLQPDRLNLKMIMTTPFCPYGPALIEQTRMTAQAAAGIPTRIELGMEMWDPAMMEEGAGADWGLF